MKIRICDLAVDFKGRQTLINVRVVDCDDCYTAHPPELNIDKTYSLHHVILYTDPETKKATMQPMWLKNMKGE